tara:strand:+ start:320 stop:496 length:177 start_codon:yes stop_codon:yes gene_type:complete
MNKKETELVLNHLEYIRKRVDDINGRVRDNEVSISWIKGIGTSITFIISCVIGYFIKE